MTSAPHPRPEGSPRAPGQPEYWLQSGQMLPKRTWQHSTRSPIIMLSSLAGLALAAVAVVALLVGVLNRSSFTAQGVVVCPTAQTQVLQVGPGTPVRIFDETGDELSTTALGQRRSGDDGRCEMPFSAKDVPAGRGGYIVRVGDVFQETVSETALGDGAVLRPLG